MKLLDRWVTSNLRHLARQTSRRSFLNRLGVVMVGTAAIPPLLPMARAAGSPDRIKVPHIAGEPAQDAPEGDPETCTYWRYCAIDGFISSCCGGSQSSCPAGTEMSPVAWLGTCFNPEDGRNYIVSYNDCCGRTACQRCFCHRSEGDKPIYNPSKNNSIDWCMGKAGVIYNSTVAVVVGIAEKEDR